MIHIPTHGATSGPPPEAAPKLFEQPVTTVILQRPKHGEQARYEAWLKEIIPVAKRFEGHRGVNIIRPHHPQEAYTVILHFASEATLQAWLNSAERQALVAEIAPHLHREEEIDIHSGLEFWFTPTAAKQAPRYKQFLVTLSAIYPLTVIVPLALAPLLALPVLREILIAKFLVALVIVALMTYVIMPRYTKAVAKWLFR